MVSRATLLSPASVAFEYKLIPSFELSLVTCIDPDWSRAVAVLIIVCGFVPIIGRLAFIALVAVHGSRFEATGVRSPSIIRENVNFDLLIVQ
jgi:hypothetical protein